jgi:hypothetical protein
VISNLVAQVNNQSLPTTPPDVSSPLPTAIQTTTFSVSSASNKSTTSPVSLVSGSNNKLSKLADGLLSMGLIFAVLLICSCIGVYCFLRRGVKPFHRKDSKDTIRSSALPMHQQTPATQMNSDQAAASPHSPFGEENRNSLTFMAMSPHNQQLSADHEFEEAPTNLSSRARLVHEVNGTNRSHNSSIGM